MERSREGALIGFLVGLFAGIVIVIMIFVNPRPFAQLLMEFFQDEHTTLIAFSIFLWVIPVVLPILGAIIGWVLGSSEPKNMDEPTKKKKLTGNVSVF